MNTEAKIQELEDRVAALTERRRSGWRSRWAAIGAAVAVSFGGGAALQFASAAPGDVVQTSFVPVSPTRILDTRPAPENVGGFVGPLTAGQTHSFAVRGVAGVPAAATAVVLNVTVDATSASSFLTVFPAGETRPTASNLNWKANDTVPNLVTVKIGATGQVSIFNLSGSAHVIADVAGYYVPGNDKFLTLPVDGVVSDNPYAEGFGNNAGVPFADSVNNSIAWQFVLPPDYTPGGQIVATFTWHVGASACTVQWAPNFVSVTRAGRSPIVGVGATTGMTLSSSPVSGASGTGQAATITLTTPVDGTPLLPGDSYSFGLFRRGGDAGDTCAATALIDSITVRYE